MTKSSKVASFDDLSMEDTAKLQSMPMSIKMAIYGELESLYKALKEERERSDKQLAEFRAALDKLVKLQRELGIKNEMVTGEGEGDLLGNVRPTECTAAPTAVVLGRLLQNLNLNV